MNRSLLSKIFCNYKTAAGCGQKDSALLQELQAGDNVWFRKLEPIST